MQLHIKSKIGNSTVHIVAPPEMVEEKRKRFYTISIWQVGLL